VTSSTKKKNTKENYERESREMVREGSIGDIFCINFHAHTGMHKHSTNRGEVDQIRHRICEYI
jgi:hypothetical protein